MGITQAIGDRWLIEARSLLLQLPSVLVPETWNGLVNPQHAEAKSLNIVYSFEFHLRTCAAKSGVAGRAVRSVGRPGGNPVAIAVRER